MDYRGVLVVLGLLGGVLAVTPGCSGPDQGVITFSERPSQGTGSGSNTGEAPAPAPTSTGSTEQVNPVFVSDAFPAIDPACGDCHRAGTSGAPVFFAVGAAATYPLFKAKNYHLADSPFVTKGAHLGPELTAEQRAAVDRWVAAEGGGAADGG
ncbi:MAG: hypothetical protein KF894_10575 [Labilithrix sp.]|nr:hypothetical protein [Labilithrix sp.]